MIFTNSLLIFSTLNIFFLKFLFYPSLYKSLSGNGYFPFFFLHFTSFWENKWNGDDTHLIKSNIYFLKSLIIIKNEKNGGDLYSPSPHSLGIPSLYLLNYFKQFLIFFLLHVLFFFVFHCLLYVTFFILIASSPAMFVIYFIFCCLNDETSFRCFKIHSKNQFSNFFLIRVKLFTGHFFYNTSIIIIFLYLPIT